MKAVARLVYSYFMSTPMTRTLTLAGLGLCAFSMYVLTSWPQSEHMLAFAAAGQIALFLGSAMMPLLFGRMAQGKAMVLLPYGRLKLLASALITVALVAAPAGLLMPFVFVAGMSGKMSDLEKYSQLREYATNLGLITYTSFCIIAGWLYLAMWFLSSQRNLAGLAKGLLVIVFTLFLPAREIRELSATIAWNVQALAVVWTIFGAGFLFWPRLKKTIAHWRLPNLTSSIAMPGQRISGREIDLILGTGNPGLLIAALTVPLVIATRIGTGAPAIWLFFLTIFSTVTGAIAGQAAERSRALWLRRGWSRADIFLEVERSFWRHNFVVLGVLLALMVLIGSYAGLSLSLLAAGLPLLILGTALSTYLGFMITRGLRWVEAALGIAIMLGLMAIPILLEPGNANLVAVCVVQGCLAFLVFILRSIARRRWAQIDWTQCRPARVLSARQA
jgi:hypothetical protein